jgi:putative spermidine/putrescine transport system ATP-binding protein
LAVVELVGLTKAYAGHAAVTEVNLKIASGEFFSLLGPSGCGKSTTLRMVAGFVTPDDGRIFIDGDDIVDRPPEKRDVGIVFQNYAIFPHMNVADNIAFGLRMRKVPGKEVARRVGDALQQVGLAGYEQRFQRQLSGGEQQRVALARVEMKYWIKDLQKSLGITTIYVTHDQGEALTMSDRIGVMSKGRVVRVGTPTEIYERPGDLFVTTFIGESNLLDGTVQRADGDSVELALGDGHLIPAPRRSGLAAGQRVKLVIRPENILLDGAAYDGFVSLPAVVEARIYQGALIRYRLTAAGQSLIAEVQNQVGRPQHDAGSRITACWHPERTEVLAIE